MLIDGSEKFEAYVAASQKLTMQIVEMLSEGLSEEDGAHMKSYFPEPCEGSVRFNYYPESATMGLPPHTDAAAMVLLHQSDGGEGLQVHKDGHWVPVQARSDAFVVLMGTVFQVLSSCNSFLHNPHHQHHICYKFFALFALSFVFSCNQSAF